MIKTEQLTRSFQETLAVDRISMQIEKGELFGLLGPNGAGKTTLINMLTGLLKPNSGTMSIHGLSPLNQATAYKKKIGLVPQDSSFYKDLSGRDNIAYFAGLYGLKGSERKKAVDEALEFTRLTEAADQKAKSYSGGMKRRLNIACGIAHNPEVIFMDEPTVGIDPQSRNHILHSVKQLRDRGATIIYTTHYMEEAESICSRIAIIDKGRIIADGTRQELQQLIKENSCILVRLTSLEGLQKEPIKAIAGVQQVEIKDQQLKITSETGVHNINLIVEELTRQNRIVSDIQMDAPNLESVFLKLTGRTLRD